MIEIILGIIVLILAIIGIAKLAQRRGGGSVNINDIVSMASNSKRELVNALYKDPEKILEAMQYLQETAKASKGALSVIYKQSQITREKVDAAARKYTAPMQNAAEYLDDIPAIANTASAAYAALRAGKIDFEQFRSYVLGEVKDQNSINIRHYKLRQTGMA